MLILFVVIGAMYRLYIKLKMKTEIKTEVDKTAVTVNLGSAREHASEIKRFIRVIKERSRALRSRLPYTKIPRRLVVAIVRHVSNCLNVFCPKIRLVR